MAGHHDHTIEGINGFCPFSMEQARLPQTAFSASFTFYNLPPPILLPMTRSSYVIKMVLNSRAQAILSPQLPKQLRLSGRASFPSLGKCSCHALLLVEGTWAQEGIMPRSHSATKDAIILRFFCYNFEASRTFPGFFILVSPALFPGGYQK